MSGENLSAECSCFLFRQRRFREKTTVHVRSCSRPQRPALRRRAEAVWMMFSRPTGGRAYPAQVRSGSLLSNATAATVEAVHPRAHERDDDFR